MMRQAIIEHKYSQFASEYLTAYFGTEQNSLQQEGL
jgi:hypothetical protein